MLLQELSHPKGTVSWMASVVMWRNENQEDTFTIILLLSLVRSCKIAGVKLVTYNPVFYHFGIIYWCHQV